MNMHVAALAASTAVARVPFYDGGNPNEIKEVAEQINKEIKKLGDDHKKLGESLAKDVADVRKIAEEAKKAGTEMHPEVKAQLDALGTSIATKQEALEKSVKKVQEQADQIETAFKRSPVGGDSKSVELEEKDARDFFKTMLSRKGQLTASTVLTRDKMDMDGFKAFCGIFPVYLRKGDQQGLSPDEYKALSVGSDPAGGYQVAPVVSARVLTIIRETSPMRDIATVETVGTDALEIRIDEGEADAGWVGETEARAETGTPEIGVQRIPVHEIYAKPKATQTLIDDAAVDIEAWLAGKVGEKFSRTEATANFTGNGVNKPRGILTYPAAAADTPSRGKVMQAVTGNATQITPDSLVNLPFQIKSEYLNNARWLMKRSTVAAVMLFKDGQGRYLWQPSYQAGQPALLGGYPVSMANDMPAVQAGALAIAFGDFRRGYTIVERHGIRTLRDPYSAKPFVEFYTRRRVGGDVTNFEAFHLLKVSV